MLNNFNSGETIMIANCLVSNFIRIILIVALLFTRPMLTKFKLKLLIKFLIDILALVIFFFNLMTWIINFLPEELNDRS